MPSKRISEFSQVADVTNVVLAGYDPTRPVNDRNVKIAASLVGGAGYILIHTEQIITIPPLGTVTVPLVSPPAGTPSDVFLLSLEIAAKTLDAATYYFLILTGDDDVVYDWRSNSASITDTRFNLAVSLYLPYSQFNTNQYYLKIVPLSSSTMVCGVQAVASILPAVAPYVTGYVPPPEYNGPLLNDVYVGPDLVHFPTSGWTGFAEPRQAMFAIADGGTMHVAGGVYYLPFGIANDSAVDQGLFAAHKFMGPNPSLDYTPGVHANHGAARFNAGITIIGNGSYSGNPTIFNGRGGYGLDPQHRYRLTLGKGFFYDRVGCTIQGVQFINCGGADNESDGEAGIYAESFDPLSTSNITTVYKCAFDGNENGIFTGTQQGSGVFTRIALSYCDFGYVNSNGQARDGLSHNFYINCQSLTVDHCHFYGNDYGNELKARSLSMDVTNCYITRTEGRFIDFPNGGTLTVSDTTFTDTQFCNANAFGYLNEFTTVNPISSPVFTNCILNISRYRSVFWIGDPTEAFIFTDCTLNWYYNDQAPPNIIPTRNNSSDDPTAVIGLPFDPPPGDPDDLPLIMDVVIPGPISYP